MVNAVAHILVPIILLDIYRNYIAKKKFPLFYVVLAGFGGILPDIDVAVYWILHTLFGTPLSEVHRTITHTLFIPLLLIIIALIAYKFSKKFAWGTLAITFGYLIHLPLDFVFIGTIMPFYPISIARYGLNLIPGTEIGSTIVVGIDAILLTLWIIYDFSKHNIKDFI
ncbi:MAG: metal-dependent hydrolase [archaeon]